MQIQKILSGSILSFEQVKIWFSAAGTGISAIKLKKQIAEKAKEQ